MKYLKVTIVVSLLIVLTTLFSQFLHTDSTDDPRGNEYAGSGTCVNCHKETFNSYTHTSHFKTSSAVNYDQLKKLVAPSKDKAPFYFTDSSYIRVEDSDNTLSQAYFTDSKKNSSEKFDVAFGSGEKAQTYAY